MSAFLFVSALFIGFVAASGFLFGQLFSGHFSVAATMAGVGGVFCAAFAFRMSRNASWASATVYWACAASLIGVVLDAANYYKHLATPGNDHAWHIIGPFAACTVAVATVASQRRAAGA
jgi:hypothetical protein